MIYNKESLEKLLLLIDEICSEKDNLWFKNELQDKYSFIKKNNDQVFERINEIKSDTIKIKKLLNITPEILIDYKFIKHNLLRTRLEIDYLRMENVRYNLNERDEIKRLYDYCVNAFYQVENLVNYYYYEKYPKINNLLDHLEKIPGTLFKRNIEKNVGDINISIKIFSFNFTYYSFGNNDYTGFNIDSLRLIRNEGVHRCSRIKTIENENPRLHKFLKHTTFDSIHMLVEKLSLKVKENL